MSRWPLFVSSVLPGGWAEQDAKNEYAFETKDGEIVPIGFREDLEKLNRAISEELEKGEK